MKQILPQIGQMVEYPESNASMGRMMRRRLQMSQRCKCFLFKRMIDTDDLSLSVKRESSNLGDHLRPNSSLAVRRPSTVHELAGGIEDWEDVNGGDVDRYGFIMVRKDNDDPNSPEPRSIQRVSTVSVSNSLTLAAINMAFHIHNYFSERRSSC